MNIDKIKFRTLDGNSRQVLLHALGYDKHKLKCQFCNDKVTYLNCGIMPPIDNRRNATIVCDSPLCMVDYLDKMEAKSN